MVAASGHKTHQFMVDINFHSTSIEPPGTRSAQKRTLTLKRKGEEGGRAHCKFLPMAKMAIILEAK